MDRILEVFFGCLIFLPNPKLHLEILIKFADFLE